jgi:Fic family protein
LLEFKFMLMNGLPTPACHLLSNHYNRTKTEYYRQLDGASRSGGDLIPFIQYAVQGFVDGLREQIDTIRDHQIEVAWVNYVHERFSGRNSKADVRRRNLVLDLSKQSAPVPVSKLASISPAMASAYAGTTSRTLARDVNEIESMDLVVRTKAGLLANRRKILAFLPWRNANALAANHDASAEEGGGAVRQR